MIIRHTHLALLIAASLIACGRSHEDADTISGSDANSPPPEAAEPAEPPLTPPPERELSAEEIEWAKASDFEIGLKGTPCYGTCPNYEMTLRADGSLHFVGYDFVVLPGTYDVQRSAADAAQLYSNIIRRGFLGLQAKYEDEDDGCPEVWTDNPTSYYSLKANGREKKVQFYEGCEGELPGLDTLRDIQREIIEVTNLEQFFGSQSDRRCKRVRIDAMDFASSYVLRDATGKTLGTLRFTPSQFALSPSEWTASTCEGDVVSRGPRLRSGLCDNVLAVDDNSAFAWPGVDGPQAAVAFQGTKVDGKGEITRLELRLITLESQQSQLAERGDSCR